MDSGSEVRLIDLFFPRSVKGVKLRRRACTSSFYSWNMIQKPQACPKRTITDTDTWQELKELPELR